ncbi:MAG TPA: GspH/FimT family pseudopilin [Burkholderiales bacterium]|nr:GspH/FimT family pseudopilin [Burkholderiales bacterium]
MGHYGKIAFPRGAAGFTLIEILVVTFIVAAMLGMAALNLVRSDSDILRDEAERLTLLLYSAREEAVLRGQLVAFEMRTDGYRFLYVGDKGAFTTFKDGPLAGRNFTDDIRAKLEVEGLQPTGRHGLVIDPTSALPSFNVSFTLHDARWWVLGQNNGTICFTADPGRCPAPPQAPARANAS